MSAETFALFTPRAVLDFASLYKLVRPAIPWLTVHADKSVADFRRQVIAHAERTNKKNRGNAVFSTK
jgi:hypothetical protein